MAKKTPPPKFAQGDRGTATATPKKEQKSKAEKRAAARSKAQEKTSGNVPGVTSEAQRKSNYQTALKDSRKEEGLSGSGE